MEQVTYDLGLASCNTLTISPASSNTLTISLTRRKRKIREELYKSFGTFEQVVLDVDGEKHVYKADDIISILESFELPSSQNGIAEQEMTR